MSCEFYLIQLEINKYAHANISQSWDGMDNYFCYTVFFHFNMHTDCALSRPN